jgi:hypothetical protein
MSKPLKRRTSASGQYVSPLMNELEWLDEEAEEPVRKDAMAKFRRRKSAKKPQSQEQRKKRKDGLFPLLNVSEAIAAVTSGQARRPAPLSPPLLFIDKPKPRYPQASWLKELFGLDPWSEQQAGEFAEALRSFRIGLNGIMKTGEELRILSPRTPSVVIDLEPAGGADEQAGGLQSDPDERSGPRAGEAEAGAAFSDAHRLQQYGLVPLRFGPYDEWIDVGLSFGEPFADDGYALAATVNEPGCRTVIIDKTASSAVVRVLRESLSPHLSGELNWIALGDKA